MTLYYFGGAYETRSDGAIFKYYSFGGQSIVNEYKPATNAWTLSYMLTDHLGSTVAITNHIGSMTSQQRYLPFGGVRANVTTPNSPNTDYGYTGQRQLDSGIGGLMDYKFRMYSPLLGRFISPDTITPDMTQGLNRYSYVSNNPVKYTDPSGHEPGDCYDRGYCKDKKPSSTPTWIPTPSPTATYTRTPTRSVTSTPTNNPTPTPTRTLQPVSAFINPFQQTPTTYRTISSATASIKGGLWSNHFDISDIPAGIPPGFDKIVKNNPIPNKDTVHITFNGGGGVLGQGIMNLK